VSQSASIETSFDLVIRNGQVVTEAGTVSADVAIRSGIIEAIGQLPGTGSRELDATGKLVVPGGIDAHVHISPVSLPNRQLAWVDDFGSGTRAAAAGGVTTIGDITFPRSDENPSQAVQRTALEAEHQSYVDFVLHPVMLDPSPENRSGLTRLATDGFTTLKVFMNLGDFDARVDDYIEVFSEAARLGLLVLVHCEDAPITRFLTRLLTRQGRTELTNFPLTRPDYAEVAATHRAIAIAEATGARIYLVHVASKSVIEAGNAARNRGVNVHLETRPIYLVFTDEVYKGPRAGLYVGNPPIRSASDRQSLWAALATGSIDTCCTDHAPWTREAKTNQSFANTRPGMADLELMLPTLFTEGVVKNRLSLQRFTEITSTNAARLLGLHPRKGAIAIGSDADIAILDPTTTKRVRGDAMFSNAGYSVLEGRELTGWPTHAISRGEMVFEEGRIVGRPGHGRLATQIDKPTRNGPTRERIP